MGEEPQLGLARLLLHGLQLAEKLLERPTALDGGLGTLNRGRTAGQYPVEALEVTLVQGVFPWNSD